MADKKAKRKTFVSPKGIFKYPALTSPDYGNDSFPKPDGEYKVTLILDQKDADKLVEKLQPLYDEAMEAAEEEFGKMKVASRKKLGEVKPNDLFTEVYDPETEEPTGQVEFKFSMKASGVAKKTGKKWERKPALFDAKGNPMKKIAAIWGGTIGKVSFTTSPYFIPGTAAAGLKLQLEAAQIIELVAGGQRNASGYGFEEEDGFEYAEEESFSDETEGSDDSSEEEEEGDF